MRSRLHGQRAALAGRTTASNIALLALRSHQKEFSAQKALGRQSPQLTNPEPGN